MEVSPSFPLSAMKNAGQLKTLKIGKKIDEIMKKGSENQIQRFFFKIRVQSLSKA